MVRLAATGLLCLVLSEAYQLAGIHAYAPRPKMTHVAMVDEAAALIGEAAARAAVAKRADEEAAAAAEAATEVARQMMAEKVTESQELFQGLCDYIKWRAANPVDHEMVRRIKLSRRRPSRPKPEEGSAGLGLRHRRLGNVPVPPR